jgi:hypothetical protein
MKTRRHHNNKGLLQIRRGKIREQVKRIAEKLNIPYRSDCTCYGDYVCDNHIRWGDK